MQDQDNTIRNVTLTGMFCNILLTAAKILVGFFCYSHALIADGIHSLSDLVTDAVLLIGIRYWSAPPDEEHPYGHARIQTIVTVIIGAILALTGFSIGFDALTTLSQEREVPGYATLVIALVSIGLKEWLFRWSFHYGEKLHSSALRANAWHHRSDAFSSIPVALAVVLARCFPGLGFVDNLGAAIVSLFILHAAWETLKEPLLELTDTVSPSSITEIRNIASGVNGVLSVHQIRIRPMGSGLFVDMHILLPPLMTVRDGHAISTLVCRKLIESNLSIRDVVVHIEPADDEDSDSQERITDR